MCFLARLSGGARARTCKKASASAPSRKARTSFFSQLFRMRTNLWLVPLPAVPLFSSLLFSSSFSSIRESEKEGSFPLHRRRRRTFSLFTCKIIVAPSVASKCSSHRFHTSRKNYLASYFGAYPGVLADLTKSLHVMEGHTLLPLLSLLSFFPSLFRQFVFSRLLRLYYNYYGPRGRRADFSLSLSLFPAAMFEVMISSGAIQ